MRTIDRLLIAGTHRPNQDTGIPNDEMLLELNDHGGIDGLHIMLSTTDNRPANHYAEMTESISLTPSQAISLGTWLTNVFMLWQGREAKR